jgi:hypothetical protein
MEAKAGTAATWDQELLDSLFREPMRDSLRMLMIRDMALLAGNTGRAPVATLAQRFSNFFGKRHQEGKREERTHVLVSNQSLEWWQRVIRERAAREIRDLMIVDGDYLAFKPERWPQWTPGFRKAVRNVAETRLIEYFESRVETPW